MKKKNSGADPIILGIIGITAVVFIGIIISSVVSRGESIESYQITDSERPRLEISETNLDFGEMDLSETKIKEIEVKNAGEKPLVISDVLTSCDCTFAQFVIDGKESRQFSMQGDAKWRGEIQPDQKVVLKVIYKPSIMPVKGNVNRAVFFKTNDPENPAVNISFTAYVK